jgi:Lrp/AsnC family transcriptional regulator for asnA, asnC and gidA
MTLSIHEPDQLDQAIIRELQQDARRSYKHIAADLGVSEGTIGNRVNRLLKSGVLKLQARVDPFKLPGRLVALIGINLERRQHGEAMRQIERLSHVTAVWSSTGKFDLFVEVMVESISQLNEFIFDQGLSQVNSVTYTESFVMIDSKSKFMKL